MSGLGINSSFARRNLEFLVSPNTAGETLNLYYYRALDPLIDDSDTNFFVTDAPEMLVYGALAEMALFTKNKDELAVWEAKFQSSLLELEILATKAEWSGDTLSVTPNSQD